MYSFVLQIETGEEDDDSEESSDSESNDTLDLSKVTEIRLVPSDPSQCIRHFHYIMFPSSTLISYRSKLE